jgi:alkylation response protein AidB-like acyl-CoA dehydrogenase
MEFLTEEQRLIQETVRRISREKIAPHVDEAYEKGKASREILKALAENGLLIISLPREFGGIEANATTRALVIEELAKVDGSTSMYVFTSQTLPAFLLAYGTHEQKERFFGFLSSGDKICSFCLTEPNHGSDARSIKTTATLDGDHYKLNGTKSFISSGTLASLYLVFARTKEGISSYSGEGHTWFH